MKLATILGQKLWLNLCHALPRELKHSLFCFKLISQFGSTSLIGYLAHKKGHQQSVLMGIRCICDPRSGKCLPVSNNILISCKSVPPFPAWVEEPVSSVRYHEQSTLSQDALSQHGKVGCQNWHPYASAYSAAGGEHDQQCICAQKVASECGHVPPLQQQGQYSNF